MLGGLVHKEQFDLQALASADSGLNLGSTNYVTLIVQLNLFKLNFSPM